MKTPMDDLHVAGTVPNRRRFIAAAPPLLAGLGVVRPRAGGRLNLQTVVDFGADRTGGSGHTSKNYDAFMQAAQYGGIILEPGSYVFDRPFDPTQVSGNIGIVGFGGQRNCLMQPHGDFSVLVTTQETRMSIDGVGFDGTDFKVNQSHPLVYLQHGSTMALTDVRVQNSGNHGLVIGTGVGDYPSRIILTRPIIQYNAGVGLVLQANDWKMYAGAIEYNQSGGMISECGQWQGGPTPDDNVLVDGCRFEGNEAVSLGVRFLNGTPTVRNCYFSMNHLVYERNVSLGAKQYENAYYSGDFVDRRCPPQCP